MLGCQQRSGELEAEWGSRYRKAKLSATWKVSSVGERAKIRRTRMLQVGMKYSMRDLIYDVTNYCVHRCNTGQ